VGKAGVDGNVEQFTLKGLGRPQIFLLVAALPVYASL
jgi:hypothetical protein